MSTPVITIFVRLRSKTESTVNTTGMSFPVVAIVQKHFRWTQNAIQYRRKAGTRSWEEAEEIKRQLQDQLAGRTPEDGRKITSAPSRRPLSSSSRTRRSRAYQTAW